MSVHAVVRPRKRGCEWDAEVVRHAYVQMLCKCAVNAMPHRASSGLRPFEGVSPLIL